MHGTERAGLDGPVGQTERSPLRNVIAKSNEDLQNVIVLLYSIQNALFFPSPQGEPTKEKGQLSTNVFEALLSENTRLVSFCNSLADEIASRL